MMRNLRVVCTVTALLAITPCRAAPVMAETIATGVDMDSAQGHDDEGETLLHASEQIALALGWSWEEDTELQLQFMHDTGSNQGRATPSECCDYALQLAPVRLGVRNSS